VLANAVAYTPDEQASIRIVAHEEEQSVVLTIADNGCGILPAELPRVFDKGFTGSNGRRNVASTGLGLYLVRKLADQIGLGVSIDSAVGEGTTVTIVFPVLALAENRS
jgi:signal transduction histidine kinase